MRGVGRRTLLCAGESSRHVDAAVTGVERVHVSRRSFAIDVISEASTEQLPALEAALAA
jgi:hypothetical protein